MRPVVVFSVVLCFVDISRCLRVQLEIMICAHEHLYSRQDLLSRFYLPGFVPPSSRSLAADMSESPEA